MHEVTTGMRKREREREVNWRLGMGPQKGIEKKDKFTLGTERCENKKVYIYIYIYLFIYL